MFGQRGVSTSARRALFDTSEAGKQLAWNFDQNFEFLNDLNADDLW